MTTHGFARRFNGPFGRLSHYLLLVWLAASMVLSPVMTNQAQARFTIEDEKELGRKFSVLIKSRLPLIEDPEIVSYVEDLVKRIEKSFPAMPFEIKTSVIRHNSINAFAAPAGYVFVFSGLILNFENESQVASVISHELAHVHERHLASRIEKMQAVSLLSLLGVLAGIFLGGEAGGALTMSSVAAGQTAMLKFSRDDERDADDVGMRSLVTAGYRPQGMPEAFEIIKRYKWYSGGPNIPSYLSTHPALEERITQLQSRVKNLPQDVQDRTVDNTRFKRVQTLLRARFTDADNALQIFRNKEEETCYTLMGQGIALDRLNKITDADAAFEKALACAPEDPLVLREAGRFNFKRGDLFKADTYIRKALEANPDDLICQFYLGRLLGEEGRTEEAARSFERILRKLPEDPEVHYTYGRIMGEGGRYFEAHLHLAYSALYSNDKKQTKFHLEKVQHLAKTPEQEEELAKLEETYKERSEFW